MREIPENNHDDYKVFEKLVDNILSDHRFPKFGATTCVNVGRNTCERVLDVFKKKGYYTYYLQRFDGVWIELQVYNHDYQPSNDGCNRLFKY